jgi:hypothetical protein
MYARPQWKKPGHTPGVLKQDMEVSYGYTERRRRRGTATAPTGV